MHPLTGIRVLDFSTMLNGPYTTMLLSDMGAEVIKVESFDGDPWRSVAGGFMAVNRGKRGISLDLKKEAARDIAYRLVERCDVLVENARWGVWHRLGLDYDSVVKKKPDLIYVSVLAHGSSGPLSSTPGYDPLLQSRSGQSAGQGGLGKPPVFHATPLNDMATPMLGAYGAVLGLLVRARTGKGQHIESSLTNASIALQSGEFLDYAGMKQKHRGAPGLKGLSAVHRLYEAGDKRWMFILCRQEEHWHSLCGVLEMEALLSDPRFETPGKRLENDEALAEVLRDAFSSKSSSHWIEALSKANVPVVPAQSAEAVLKDRHCDDNDYFAALRDPEFGPVRLPGVGPRFSRMSGIIRRPAPMLGQQTFEIMRELGYTEKEIIGLKEKRVVYQAEVPE